MLENNGIWSVGILGSSHYFIITSFQPGKYLYHKEAPVQTGNKK